MAGVLWVDLSTGQSWSQELPDAHRSRSPGFGLLGVELLLGKTEPGLSVYHSDQHPLGPRYDAVEHDIDFDPVAGSESFIANAGLPNGLPMTDLSDGKVELVADLMQLWSGYDAVGLCLFAAPPTRNLTEHTAAELVSAVSGWQVTPADIREWGRRRLTLMRRYNLREGLTSADDTLPDRFFTLPVDGGRLAGAVLDRARFETATVRLRNLLGWV